MTGADKGAAKKNRAVMSDSTGPIRRIGERKIVMPTTLELRTADTSI
jgi:hypothetical protein